MRIVVCLLALSIAVAHGGILNVEKCALDRDGACRSYDSAKQCDTVWECKALFWYRETSEDDICTFCKDGIGDIQKFLEEKSTKAAVYNEIYAICELVPIQEIKDQCEQLVHDDFNAIYDMVVAMVDPTTVCTELQLCNAIESDLMKKLPDMLRKAMKKGTLPIAAPYKLQPAHQETNADSCSDCEAFLNDVQTTVLNNKKVVNDWMNLLKTECKALGGGLDSISRCQEVAEIFVFQMMTQHTQNTADAKSICKTIMMCESFATKRVGDTCTDCKAFFTDWQQMLRNNKTLIDKIVDNVSKFYCLQKPSDQQKQCARYVSMVIKVLLERMEREDVGEICRKLEFCSTASLSSTRGTNQIAKKLVQAVMTKIPLPNIRKQVNGDACTDCKNFMTDLQSAIVNDPSLVQKVIDLAKDQCGQLGPAVGPVCKLYIDENAATIEKQFLAFDVDTICFTIEMCTELPKVKLLEGEGNLCDDCVAFFGDWQQIIANNQSIIAKLVNNVTETVCATVPEFIRFECKEEFGKVAAEVEKGITENDPSEVCATLYLCGGKAEVAEIRNVQDIIRQATPKTKPKQLKAGIDIECGACQFAIEEVEKAIEGNKTEEEIEKALQMVCELYGADIRQECKDFMMQHGADVIDFLVQEMNSLDICQKLGLCNPTMWRIKHHKMVKSADQCGICEAIVKEIDTILINEASEESIKEAFEQVCKIVPSKYRAGCEKTIEKYGPEMIKMILRYGMDPSLVCWALTLCDSPMIRKTPPVKIPFVCDLCKRIIEELDKKLDKNSTEAEIIAALENVCSLFPDAEQAECKRIIDEDVSKLVKAIVEFGTDPTLVCDAMMLCATQPNQLVALPPVHDDEYCAYCEEAVKLVEGMLESNKTEKEILDALTKLCTDLGKYASECEMIVNEYGPSIIEALVKEVSPSEVCTLVKLCSAGRRRNEIKASVIVSSNDLECDVCKAVAEELQNLLNENATEAEIIAAVEEVCGILPDSLKTSCDQLIEQYGPDIINILLEELDPSKICSELKLCTSLRVPKVESSITCDACEAVMTALDSILKEDATKAEIEDALMHVCAVLPSSLQQDCNSLIQQYGEDIIELLVAGLAPWKICTEIKLCTSVSSTLKVSDDEYCAYCKEAVQLVEGMLESNKTEKEILDALTKVCTDLGKYDSECEMIVNEYGPSIIEALIKDVSPSEVCTLVKLCSTSRRNEIKASVIVSSNDLECDACKAVAEELQNVLHENATKEEIIAALEGVCGVLPDSLKESCDQLIEQYTPEIIEILEEEMDPSKICSELKLCTSQRAPKTQEKSSGEICELCKMMVGQLDDLLKDKTTQDEIENALKSVCALLPQDFKVACDNMIDSNWDQMVNFLVATFDPSTLCPELKLCPSASGVKVSDDEYCAYCKEAVQLVEGMLESNKTEKEILDALTKLCTDLGKYASECEMIVNEYGPAIIAALVKEVSPSEVCTLVKLCSASRRRNEIKASVIVSSNDLECDACKAVAEELQNVLNKNSTKAEIIAALEGVCGVLPDSLKESCDQLIEQYTPEIIEILEEEMDPSKICSELKLCTSQRALKTQERSSGEICELCKMMVGQLDDLLKDKTTQTEIEKALKSVCALLPQDFKVACDNMIDSNWDQMVQFLVATFDPSTLCPELKLCASPSGVKVSNDFECELCKDVAQYLDQVLSENATETEIEKALEEVCGVLPSSIKDQCDTFVAQYAPVIIELLVNEIAPDKLCVEIKLCTANLAVPSKVGSEVDCDICKDIAAELNKWISQKSTQDEIEQALEKVCSLLPSIQQECDKLIEDNFKTIVSILVMYSNPNMICTELKLCPGVKGPTGQNDKSIVFCTGCHIVMAELKKLLNEQSTDAEILSAVQKVCDFVPDKKDRAICVEYISDYGPGILSILFKEMDPDTLCQKLHECSKGSEQDLEHLPHGSEFTCTLCKDVIKAVDEQLAKNATQAALEKELMMVCTEMPSSLSSECKSLVNQYVPMIFEYIEDIGDPNFICEKIKLCPSDLANKKVMLGVNPCTYGPSYWCKSMEAARECNAVSHCRNHVWD